MGISFGSINTGLPKDIVQQLVEAEKIPLKQMENRKSKVEDKKALLQDLITRVENMRGDVLLNKNARSLRELKVNNPGDIVNITADKNIADPGKYQLEVMELAKKSSAISNAVEDKDKTYLGVGYIGIKMANGEEKEIYVDEKNSNLTGIAKLINNGDLGFRASVVNDGKDPDQPWRLMLSMSETGDENIVEFPYLYLVDGEEDLFFEQQRDAQDAKIKLDGFEIEVPSNRVTDLISGVTIDLLKAKPGDEFTIEITEDIQKITEKMSNLITKINDVLKFIKEQNSLDEKSDTSRTLGGDLTLQTIESRLRSAIFTPVMTEAGAKRIGDLGITYQRSGLIQLDPSKFESAVAQNYKVAAQILTGMYTPEGGKTDGFMDQLDNIAKNLLSPPSGALPTRKQGLQSQMDQIDRQISSRQKMIERKEEILKQKFARLEETMSRIKGQGSGLAGLTQGMNPVQNLG